MEGALSKDLSQYPQGIVVVIDKPYGWTSADAVRKIKFMTQRWFGLKNIKVGHAGTLDPLATGILLICIGKATKMADTLQSQKKEYIAEITFGATTPSYDLEKEIDATYPFEHITRKSIEDILPVMSGEIDQIPPVFSAKLINGKRAYEYAREGKETEMKPSRISIYGLEIVSWNSPVLRIAISCSKGTYIRSFARDIGLELNSGAHLSGLVRSASGDFRVEDAINIDNLKLFLE
ncbi:MAG: tRNA pseudouridine(55) synthase TruB [Bacteroidetes bacterium GWE2_39_28]|nr:MAG: tRNA pseudouridine(55) synthase TruB [Bacteroidetes bacterium GWE2_39_28]OFY11695.1 MAG: tRNA pseudouridine(55) synthase TruB [Bacteroidetes bacterium GWF2_39_10]OFZ06675.1 MAG: tRNA pseudouridine(55) synthase TruB [Bacteroidetes bacterium RIFOXYB2_FULL_39_7]